MSFKKFRFMIQNSFRSCMRSICMQSYSKAKAAVKTKMKITTTTNGPNTANVSV